MGYFDHFYSYAHSTKNSVLKKRRKFALVALHVLAVAFILSLPSGIALAQDPPPPPPEPSQGSTVGQTVTNPETGTTTTVSELVVDPASTPTSGDVAFVKTADGYTFLVKMAGEKFYNSDNPPIEFDIVSIDGSGEVTVTTSASDGSVNEAEFAEIQPTTEFEANFQSTGEPTEPTVDLNVAGATGVRQVKGGSNGSNGRAGALFVPPANGGNGSTPGAQNKTLTGDINATANVGWEVGSVGGNGGKGGNSYLSFFSAAKGGAAASGGTVNATQTQTSEIVTSGTNNHGIQAYSRSGKAGAGGDAILALSGGGGGAAANGGTVNLTANGKITTQGTAAAGIYAQSVGNNGGEGGTQIGLVGSSGGGAGGGNGGTVNVTTGSTAQIVTKGDYAPGIFAQSIGGTGGNAGNSYNLIVSKVNDGDRGGSSSPVTITNGGLVQTEGNYSTGLFAQSIGGGGGSGGTAGGLIALGGAGAGGGSGNDVTITNSATGKVVTKGIGSTGIIAQSIGGSGGNGSVAGGLVAIGGDGSAAGNGAKVTVNNFGTINTTNIASRGLVAQSIGGGGGDGGSTGGMVSVGGKGSGGGIGGEVFVTNDGVITTVGDDSTALIAQSIGGGGGNGGSSGAVGAFVGVAIGGDGGAGGKGGNVNVTLSDTEPTVASSIKTSGDRSTGVFVQSIGGGGGNGGGAVAVSAGFGAAASVAVGGSAGAGGDGGTVTLTGLGNASVETGGEDATGVMLQSVGGGGGNGGYAVSVALSAGPVAGSVGVSVGGTGGTGGDGGIVNVGTLGTVGFEGAVVTNKARSLGMIFQSVGGGGGNGGLAVAATGAASFGLSGNVSVAVGGAGNSGGKGGVVTVNTNAKVTTLGDFSTGMIAQSVGGGGGNGGGSIAAGVGVSGGASVGVNVGVGGAGGPASEGGNVTLIANGSDVQTSGASSTGIIAQSVGGGGGNGGYAVGAGANLSGSAATVSVGLGGKAGGGGAGGIVKATIGSNVTTKKENSGGVLVQSVGGGGGNGGFAVSAALAGGGLAGTVNVGLGGEGGDGGTGGKVTEVAINGDIRTEGARSTGVTIQSIGGGGGNGGFSVAAGGAIGAGAATVGVGLGGKGASGGDAGDVDGVVTGNVVTLEDHSGGVVFQSIGGGGGNGGFNVTAGLSGAAFGGGSVAVGLGGEGDKGGIGKTVDGTVSGMVVTSGDDAVGVLAQSVGGGGGNGGFNVSAGVSIAGKGSGAVSVGLGGKGGMGAVGGDVTLETTNTIVTGFSSTGDANDVGDRSSAFVAQSIGGGGGNGGFNVSGAGAGAGVGSGAVSVGLGGAGDGGGDAGTVNATSRGMLQTNGFGAGGFIAQSIGGGGGNGGFNVSASVAGAGTGAGGVSVGLGGSGAGGGDGKKVTAETSGDVFTQKASSVGILAQSVGGGGGNGGFNVSPAFAGGGTGAGAVSVGLGGSGAGGGKGGEVDLTVDNNVLTLGEYSTAVIAQSIGGGGGNGGFNVSPTGAGAGTGAGSVAVGIGGSGADGGDAMRVDSDVEGALETRGLASNGLLVQSVGGGGGNGGFNVSGSINLAGTGAGGASVGLGGTAGKGGTSGIVDSEFNGSVKTVEKMSSGVIVQSLGGGGGNGGMNVSATITAAGTGSGGAAVGLGGSGGDGGDANKVTSNVTGTVETTGEMSSGVIVQSAGGGGGNGGINVSAALNLSGKAGGALGVGIGGSGGGGGDGNEATSTVTGTVTTQGDLSTGVLVQSLGGGGGNGGMNITAAASIGLKGSAAGAIGVGGMGGMGGKSALVKGTFDGFASTQGDFSNGVVAQSLGGGGGNGGLNVSAAVSVGSDFSGALGVGVGGFGGDGGAGGSVDHTVTGQTMTFGDNSMGVVTQSLGGGGGNGGTNVNVALNIAKGKGGAIGIGVGGFGGGGSDAGDLTMSRITGGVMTKGNSSTGVLTQSIGGGGGNGGTNLNFGVNLTQAEGAAVSLGVGGFGGKAGAGKTVKSTVKSNTLSDGTESLIMTMGKDSTGILAQSVGGGGGTGGLNVSGTASITGKSGGAISLGLGGFGGEGGDAGTVTLNSTTDVVTLGNNSDGVFAQSLGGGGGIGGTNVSGSVSLTKPAGSNTILSVAAGVGGFGGDGGDAKDVTVDYTGAINTVPMKELSDGTFELDLKSGANGLVAQSLGGGGGNGGTNISAGLSISGKPGEGQADKSKSYGVLIGVGGFGGKGGDAGDVDVDVRDGSTVTAHGTGKSGIFAQSLGGGGGNGGVNVSGGITSDSSLIVGVGGFGGGSGTAGNVDVKSFADIVVTTDPDDIAEPSDESFETKLRDVLGDEIVDTTEGLVDGKGLKGLFTDLGLFDETADETDGSAGLMAQSIGGGGGNGGLNVSGGVNISKDGKVPSITFGIGGFGGAGNIAGNVDVDHTGDIGVAGKWKHGIFAQSIGGGGGNGGMNVSGQLNYGSSNSSNGKTDLSIVAGLGGHGGTGATAGDVSVISDGNIATTGYHARGIFAQSIGGGGGTGGINVTAVGTKDSSPIALGVGGFGAAGNDAGDVSVQRGTVLASAGTIQTDGVGAHGIEASSIGGGGGDAGVNAVIGFSKTSGTESNSGSKDDRKTPNHTGVDDSVITNYNSVLDELEGKANPAPTDGSKKSGLSALVSIGGNAGNAGNGGDVDIDHFGNVLTQKNTSYGVFGQSIGGGGGNAAMNFGMIQQSGNSEKTKGFGLAVGGGTGDGGTGGNVDLRNTGDVTTLGDDAHGVFAQSVGGGGGNASYNSASNGPDGGSITMQIGREGGTGGAAGTVFASSDGTIFTMGTKSHGLFAQSIGNGGGNSGSTSLSLGTPKSGEEKSDSYSLSVGLEGGEGGAAGDVEAVAKGFVVTQGEGAYGIFAQSVGGGGGNGGSAGGSPGEGTSISVNIGGTGGEGGVSGDVKVTNDATIMTASDTAIGIIAQSIGGAGGTGGYVKSGQGNLDIAKGLIKGSEVGETSSLNIGGKGGEGMVSGDVTVNSNSSIQTKGMSAHGIFAQSVGGGGGMGGLVENKIVNLKATVATQNTMSLGGDGGEGATSGDVLVENTDMIFTEGERAAGIYAQSVGGGGGDAQHVQNIILGQSADNAKNNAILVGGKGGEGAAGGKVTVKNIGDAQIVTEKSESHGIFAQSVGGGGGVGSSVLSVDVETSGSGAKTERGLQVALGGDGGKGGLGGETFVENSGTIVTKGEKAHGIIAQSIGGGGGIGGSSISGNASLIKGKTNEPSASLKLGGTGGDGQAGGKVTVDNSGSILVSNEAAYGIIAQSVGGGGGNGGMTVSLSDDLSTEPDFTLSEIAIGGDGGKGADGGDVEVDHTGDITVMGNNAYGIFAQSVGGGGGNAGMAVSNPSLNPVEFVLNQVLGAKDGTDGVAGEVTVNSSGDIVVDGENSQAILTQSINGGGGTADTFLDFTGVTTSAAEGTVLSADGGNASVTNGLSLGGTDLSGSVGAAVSQDHSGDIMTTKDRSAGSILQSIGGGGGVSMTDLRFGDSGTVELEAVLGAIETDTSSGGNITASRTGNVMTEGALSTGGQAQSIGGGGGRLVLSSDAPSATGSSSAKVTLGSDPSTSNDGGAVDLTLAGDMQTTGDFASAQIVQSIGAGGGDANILGLDTVSVTLGAQDGSTGNGNAIGVDNTGNVLTTGTQSHGFVLQTVGGGGGIVATDLAEDDVELVLSDQNSGDGGAISFQNDGYIATEGTGSIGLIAQSLGGGGGIVDSFFMGSAGGAGQSGEIDVTQNGNLLSLGENGIGLLAQSLGKDGAAAIDLTFSGVVMGGSGSAEKAAALVIDGGAANTVELSSESFLMSMNDQLINAGDGIETIAVSGRAIGNMNLGTGANQVQIAQGAEFYALDTLDLDEAGLLSVSGSLALGGEVMISEDFSASISSNALSVAANISQTTELNGAISFATTADYTADVSFLQTGAAGGQSDLINATSDAQMGGELLPVLNRYERALPLVLIDTDGTASDAGTMIKDTVVVDYSIGLNGSTGDGSSIDLNATPDFSTASMNKNQSAVGDYINDVLNGQGSVAMGDLFAVIANMETEEEVVSVISELTTEDYAANQVDTFNSALTFANKMQNCENSGPMTWTGSDYRCGWITADKRQFDREQTTDSRALKTQALSFTGGFRIPVSEDLYLGFALGNDSVNLENGDQFKSSGSRMQAGLSLLKVQNDWTYFAGLSTGSGDYDSQRFVNISGTLPNGDALPGPSTATVKQKVKNTNLRFGVAYRYQPTGSKIYAKPGLNLDATHLKSKAATETGNAYGLSLASTSQWIVSLTPSVEVGTDYELGKGLRMRSFIRGEVSMANKDSIFVNATLPGASAADGSYANYSELDNRKGKFSVGMTIYDDKNLGYFNIGLGYQRGRFSSASSATASIGVRF